MRNVLVLAILLLAAPSALAQSDVTIAVDQFGAGNVFRPGGFCAMRLKLSSSLTEAMPVWVQWEVPNADGDIGEYGRSLTITPGVPAMVWLYAPLAPDVDGSTVWTVRVFEERDGVRRRELGGARIDPRSSNSQKVELENAMIGVIGSSQVGLGDYNVPGDRLNRPIGAHEDTRIVFGMSPPVLPDRWEGLMQYEAIAWAGARDMPQDLSLDQANALMEYVFRGGHLVISLPAAGAQWGLGNKGQNLLEDLLPEVAPRTDVAVPLKTLLPILSKSDIVRRDIETSIRVFKDLKGDFDATSRSTRWYEPLIALPDGRVVVITRTWGMGWVTLIGIDLTEQLTSQGLPQADVFWNRILGKRCDTPTFEEQIKINDADRLSRMSARDLNLGSGNLFKDLTDFPGEAGLGLLLALVLFATYWLLAGPLGFAILKQYKQVKHAWVVFAACAGLFTAVAWGAVGLLPKQLSVKHVTFLDRIARPPDQAAREQYEPQMDRAISYFAVRLPGYQPTPIAIESVPEQRDLLASWIPPPASEPRFANVDRYRVDVGRDPARFSIPSRATATRFYANYMGPPDSDFGAMITFDPENPIEVVKTADGEALRGRIINNLPGTLVDYTLIWVKNDRILPIRYERSGDKLQPWVPASDSGSMLNVGRAWRWNAGNNPMVPGGTLDVGSFTSGSAHPLSSFIDQRYIDDYVNSEYGPGATSTFITENDRNNFIEMLSLFGQMRPPIYLRTANARQDPETLTMHRELGRELDLGPWFTRPCVILIGYLDRSPSPVPLRMNNEDDPPPSEGLTIVRWIYPLPLNEELAFSEVFEQKENP